MIRWTAEELAEMARADAEIDSKINRGRARLTGEKLEHYREYQRQYRKAHRQQLNAYQREYYAAHREEINVQDRRRYRCGRIRDWIKEYPEILDWIEEEFFTKKGSNDL